MMAALTPLPAQSSEDSVSDPQSVRHPLPQPAGGLGGLDGDDLSWLTEDDMALLRVLRSPVSEAETVTDSLTDANIDRRSTGHPRQSQPLLIRLPKGTKPVRLVGEGAANAVFEIALPPSSQTMPSLKNTLLRVAKVPAMGEASTNNYLLQHKFYHSVIRPLMGEYPVHQDLVILHDSDLIGSLNAILQETDRSRDPRFRGTFVGQADWGFLVEDVRPGKDDGRILVEFKPKWLLQSPSAPKNAIRCRQCALELRKFVQNPTAKKPRPENKPCPLALGNPDAPPQVRSAFRIAPEVQRDNKRLEAALAKVMDHDVIHLLRRHQSRLDKTGPLHMSSSDYDFSMAMTLRDCTCFALIPTDDADDRPITVRLCDFDCKDPSVKHERWASTEKALVQGGFYTADWILCGDKAYFHPPTLCALEWTRPEVSRTKPEIIHFMDDPTDDDSETPEENSSDGIYTHKTDLATLQTALRGFELEPEGTPPETTYNPYRPRPNLL